MEQVTTIGLDTGKHVFHVHGADGHGRMVFSRKLSRARLLPFFAAQPRCVESGHSPLWHDWGSSVPYEPCFFGW